jgi:hypothetical protein
MGQVWPKCSSENNWMYFVTGCGAYSVTLLDVLFATGPGQWLLELTWLADHKDDLDPDH